jgi:hypothetical protein
MGAQAKMTAEDHKNYPKTLKNKTVPQLMWIIKDCREVLAGWPDHPNGSWYLDEIHYAAAELRLRQNGNCGR